jgi:hypothetical protein
VSAISNEEHRSRTEELNNLIVASTESSEWAAPVGSAGTPDGWQAEVLSRILTFTIDQEIQYLSSAKLDDESWDFIAFTETRVVRVLVDQADGQPARIETTTFPRDSLESLELLDVGAIPDDEAEWPADLNLIGHYRSASIPLPLDGFASGANKRELVRLLRSLLQDVSH